MMNQDKGNIIDKNAAVNRRASQLKQSPALAFVNVFMARQRDKIKHIEDTWVNAAPEKWAKMAAEKIARLSVLEEYEQAAKDQAREDLKNESK